MDEHGVPAAADTQYLIGQALRDLLRLAPEVHATLAARLGVGLTDLMALDHLTSTTRPMGVVELGDRLGIRSASATVLVDRLVAAGHLQRSAHPTDRRRRVLHTTPTAQTDVREVLAPLVAGLNHATERLDDRAGAIVLQFLRDACRALEQFADASPLEATDQTLP